MPVHKTTVSVVINHVCDTVIETTAREMNARGYRAANELRNASLIILKGQRSGRVYNKPGTGRTGRGKKKAKVTYRKYRASAPGEPPAVRTGTFRRSWHPRTFSEKIGTSVKVHSIIENDQKVGKHNLGNILENGTSKMAARPHHELIIEKAKKKIVEIYSEDY